MKARLRELLRKSESAETPEPEPKHEQCISCNADLDGSRSFERYKVCHSCGFHFHLTARERLATLLDPGSFHEDDRSVTAIDPISFEGRRAYRARVINAQRRTGLAESALTGTGNIVGREVVVAVLDFSFLGGSIGVVAGERLARAFEKAAARKTAIITVSSTSGTRMQEGLLALMQAPRIAAAAKKHERTGQPHIAIVTDPTTGSAYAGFVSLADVIIAEPNALVGYGALRALEEAEGHDLPAGAHTSESHLKHGLIDAVVARSHMRDTVALLLDLIQNQYHPMVPRNPLVLRCPWMSPPDKMANAPGGMDRPYYRHAGGHTCKAVTYRGMSSPPKSSRRRTVVRRKRSQATPPRSMRCAMRRSIVPRSHERVDPISR